MGFDLINEVKSRIKSNFNGTLKPDYRTSVLNDFSIVTKAVFYIIKYDKEDGGKTTNSKYSVIEKLPVQINPDNIRKEHTVKLNTLKSLATSTNDPIELSRSYDTSQRDNLRLDLDYDIYDEYIMRTGGMGISDAIANKISDVNVKPSLKNENFTSLPKLIQAAEEPGTYVFFEWGETSHFGIITEINVNYTTFSRYGEPLKAKVEINIAKQDLNVKDIKNSFNDANNIMKVNKKVETAKKVFLGITGALR